MCHCKLIVQLLRCRLGVDSGARIARLKFRPKRMLSRPVNFNTDHSNSTLLTVAGERGLLFYRFILPSVQ